MEIQSVLQHIKSGIESGAVADKESMTLYQWENFAGYKSGNFAEFEAELYVEQQAQSLIIQIDAWSYSKGRAYGYVKNLTYPHNSENGSIPVEAYKFKHFRGIFINHINIKAGHP